MQLETSPGNSSLLEDCVAAAALGLVDVRCPQLPQVVLSARVQRTPAMSTPLKCELREQSNR